MKWNYKFISIITLIVLMACNNKEETEVESIEPQFELLSAEQTGIQFSNDLVSTDDFNVYRYRNFYNGGGVAIATSTMTAYRIFTLHQTLIRINFI